MVVIRVDKDKKYVDLSKKKVLPEEAAKREKYFKKAKMVHNIMKEVAVKLDCFLKDLYGRWGWDLYDKFEHAYDAFRIALRYCISFDIIYDIVIQNQYLARLILVKKKGQYY